MSLQPSPELSEADSSSDEELDNDSVSDGPAEIILSLLPVPILLFCWLFSVAIQCYCCSRISQVGCYSVYIIYK